MKITDLNPPLVWKYFEELTIVPRESKHEEQIIAYMLDFANKHN
jgi:dipeptidase D